MTAWPCGVWATSGWYCTPARRASRCSKAATGAPAVPATTVKPSGAAVTESPWLIHTDWRSGRPARSLDSARTLSSVPPYSEAPVLVTVPPRACAIDWKP